MLAVATKEAHLNDRSKALYYQQLLPMIGKFRSYYRVPLQSKLLEVEHCAGIFWRREPFLSQEGSLAIRDGVAVGKLIAPFIDLFFPRN